jgi:hypothetical protein
MSGTGELIEALLAIVIPGLVRGIQPSIIAGAGQWPSTGEQE